MSFPCLRAVGLQRAGVKLVLEGINRGTGIQTLPLQKQGTIR